MLTRTLSTFAILALATTTAYAETRDYDLGGFHSLDISAGLQAEITVSETYSVRVETTKAGVLDQVEVEVIDGVLRAGRHTSIFDIILNGGLLNMFNPEHDAMIKITLPSLNSVIASSGAIVEADAVNGDSVNLDVSSGARADIKAVSAQNLRLASHSGAKLYVAGTCETAELAISSGADLRAEDLVCRDVAIEASSGGEAEIGVTGAVTGAVSSGAEVELRGAPTSVNVESSSGGSVSLRD